VRKLVERAIRLAKLLVGSALHCRRDRHPLADQAGETGFRSQEIVWRLFTFNCLVRGLLLSRGTLTPAPGATARFNSVDFSKVFLPPFTKSMSSLSPLDTLTCPMPNKEWAIQSCGLQFLMLTDSAGAAFAAFMSITSSEGAD
jgi:hypothetical protein